MEQDDMEHNNPKKQSIPTDEYYVKDIGEASALLCKSAKLIRLQPDSDFYWFVFINKSFCENVSNDYWYGKLELNAKSYNDALRTLKDRLFAQSSQRAWPLQVSR